MSDSTISDLLHLRLERNNERFEEILATNYGRGISTDLAGEYFELPHKQARLRADWANALRLEGNQVDDSICLFGAEPESPKPGLRIENSTARGGPIRVYCYGVIGSDFSSVDFKNVLEEYPTSAIQLHINSEGGSYSEGVAIRSQIISHPAPIDVIIDSLAASAASFMIMPCNSICMAAGSYLMVHFVSASLENATQAAFESATKRMQEINSSLLGFYKSRWKGTPEQLQQALSQERYFSDVEAVAAGLADRVLSDVSRVAACVGPDYTLKGMPAELSIAARGGPSDFLGKPARQMVLHRAVTHKRSKK